MPFQFQPTLGQDAPTPYQGSQYNPGGANQPNGTYYSPPPEFNDAAEGYTLANSAYQKALARLNAQRLGSLRSAGYLGDVDPTTGMVKNIRVDTGNSFGGLQQLLHGQALEDQNAQYAAEDRGLVGGLAHQGESELHYQHQAQSGNFANQLMSTMAGYDDQQQSAKEALDQALFDLQHQAAQTAVTTGDYNPAGTGDTGGDGSGSGGGGGNSRAKTAAQIALSNITNTVKNTKRVMRLHPGATVQKKRGVTSIH